MSTTLKNLYQKGIKVLTSVGDDEPNSAAEALLIEAAQCRREDIFVCSKHVDPKVSDDYEQFIQRRADGEPVAYITGKKGFWTEELIVEPGVLVPRPETEHLIEAALVRFSKDSSPFIWDVGTGSGCISAALASELPKATIVASDVSEQALMIASKNLNKYKNRVTLLKGSLLSPLKPEGSFDLIIANLPYIKKSDLPYLPKPVQFEPMVALDGGEDGIELVKTIIKDAPEYLKKSAWMILEIGFNEGSKLLSYASDLSKYDTLELLPDLAGIPRVLCMRNKNG